MRSISLLGVLTLVAACSREQPTLGRDQSHPDVRGDTTAAVLVPNGEFGAGAYRSGAGLEDPILVHQVDPPSLSRPTDTHVQLEAVIRADGTVGEVRVVQATNSASDELAKRTASQWKFRPAQFKGKPVAALVNLEIHFPHRA